MPVLQSNQLVTSAHFYFPKPPLLLSQSYSHLVRHQPRYQSEQRQLSNQTETPMIIELGKATEETKKYYGFVDFYWSEHPS